MAEAVVHVIDDDGVPLPERRRTDADVHDEVDERPARRAHVFRLPRRHEGVVNAAGNGLGRDRHIGLAQVERMTDGFLQLLVAVGLEERSPLVTPNYGSELEGTGDRKGANLHLDSLASRLRLQSFGI